VIGLIADIASGSSAQVLHCLYCSASNPRKRPASVVTYDVSLSDFIHVRVFVDHSSYYGALVDCPRYQMLEWNQWSRQYEDWRASYAQWYHMYMAQMNGFYLVPVQGS